MLCILPPSSITGVNLETKGVVQSLDTATQRETGVDYLRLTSLDHSPCTAWDLLLSGEFAKEDRAGRKPHMRNILGYWGRVGEHCFMGKGDQGAMLQLSSHVAAALWRRAGDHSQRCTRIDVQVTYPVDDEPGLYIRSMYELGKAAPKRNGTPPALELTDTPRGAKMLTVGSRQSLVYARMYDKGRESGLQEYAGHVRWELEVKAEQATSLNTHLRESTDERYPIRAIVHQFWEQRGMVPFWETYEDMNSTPVEKRSRTDETKLAWLKSQVAPSVRALADRGRLKQALDMLFGEGLTDDDKETMLRWLVDVSQS